MRAAPFRGGFQGIAFKYFGEYSAEADAFLIVTRPINGTAMIKFIAVWL